MSQQYDSKLLSIAAMVERVVVIALLLLMLGVVSIGTLELALILIQDVVNPAKGLLFLEIGEFLEIFSFFFLILIGIELVETIRMYLDEDVVHVEVVLLAALIAAARKVIVLDLKALEPLAMIGLAAIIVSLSGGYYFIKRSRRSPS
jgi:uncharacterized membrane protein (DUF373 family)